MAGTGTEGGQYLKDGPSADILNSRGSSNQFNGELDPRS